MKLPDAWRRRLFGVTVSLAAALPARAGVLVVDQLGGPGSDFAAIQAAVDAALEGDTILVRDGTYASFTIDGKSLAVVADGANVKIQATPFLSITVRDLAAGQDVLVQGFGTNLGVAVADCQGAVWFDELENSTATTGCADGGTAGASVTDSARVTFTRCTLVGSTDLGGFTPPFTGSGVDAFSSVVQLFDCALTGGQGAAPGWYPAQPGGAGLQVFESTVTVVGCTIRGGAGGRANAPFGGSICTASHPPGGAGVKFVGTAGSVRSAESTAAGGVLSLEPLCPGKTGPPGPAIAGTGTIVPLPGFARHLRANSPVRGGETLAFELGGQPDEVPVLLVSLAHEPLAMLNGALLVGLPPADIFVLPPLSASGQASLALAVPNVGAGVESVACYAQAFFVDPSPAIWLGAGTSVVLLAAGL